MSEVRLGTETDVNRAVRTATRAFVDDPVLRWFFPSDDAYAAGAPAAFTQIATSSAALGCLHLTDDAVAVGMYLPPGRPEPPGTPPADAASFREQIPAELAARFAAFGPLREQHTPPEPHWYLGVLATHPDWQRQGLGAAVIAPVAARARTEGVPLYLETETVENVAYYRHLGFEVRSEWDVPLDGPHMWGMVLHP